MSTSTSCWSSLAARQDEITTDAGTTAEIGLESAASVPQLAELILASTEHHCTAWRLRFKLPADVKPLIHGLVESVAGRLQEEPNIVATALQSHVIVVGDIHGRADTNSAVSPRG